VLTRILTTGYDGDINEHKQKDKILGTSQKKPLVILHRSSTLFVTTPSALLPTRRASDF
jgi:hypothetical protein